MCAKNDFENKEECIIPYCDEYYDVPFERSPFKLKNLKAYVELKKIIQREKFDIIHCHTPVASILTRLCAIKSRRYGTKVIYTAHGFHFFKGAPLINWAIYYPIEKICSYFTDALITINKEDYNLAMKKMKANKIYYIPGIGIDTDKYSNLNIDKVKKRKELGITKNEIMILSVGELNKNKNHEVIMKAIAKIDRKNIHYFIAGKGELKDYLSNLSIKLGIENRVHLLGFRKDIAELCEVADIFCFPSKREGLGLSALEAMACGLPILTSNIHGINDYSIEGVTGFKCDATKANCFKYNIERIIINKELASKMKETNKLQVKKYDLVNVKNEMERIYGEIL